METLPEAGKTDTQQFEVHQRGEGRKECAKSTAILFVCFERGDSSRKLIFWSNLR